MSKLGPAAALASDNQDGSGLLGREFGDEIDAEARLMIENCAEVARQIVLQNAQAMKALALLLVEKETMLKDEWRAAKASVLG